MATCMDEQRDDYMWCQINKMMIDFKTWPSLYMNNVPQVPTLSEPRLRDQILPPGAPNAMQGLEISGL